MSLVRLCGYPSDDFCSGGSLGSCLLFCFRGWQYDFALVIFHSHNFLSQSFTMIFVAEYCKRHKIIVFLRVPLSVALRQRLFGRHHLKEEAGHVSVRSVICVILPLLFPSSSNIYRTYSWVCDIDIHVVILWIWWILCLIWGCKLHFLVWKYASQSSLHM